MYNVNYCKPDARKYPDVAPVFRVCFLMSDGSHFETSAHITDSILDAIRFFQNRIHIFTDYNDVSICFLQQLVQPSSGVFAKWLEVSHYVPQK